MSNNNVKETSWTIHLGDKSQKFEMSYTELEGMLQSINFSITNKNTSTLQMTPNEFQKVYLLLRSFHDLLISNDINNEQSTLHQDLPPKDALEGIDGDSTFNTEEWDPW